MSWSLALDEALDAVRERWAPATWGAPRPSVLTHFTTVERAETILFEKRLRVQDTLLRDVGSSEFKCGRGLARAMLQRANRVYPHPGFEALLERTEEAPPRAHLLCLSEVDQSELFGEIGFEFDAQALSYHCSSSDLWCARVRYDSEELRRSLTLFLVETVMAFDLHPTSDRGDEEQMRGLGQYLEEVLRCEWFVVEDQFSSEHEWRLVRRKWGEDPGPGEVRLSGTECGLRRITVPNAESDELRRLHLLASALSLPIESRD